MGMRGEINFAVPLSFITQVRPDDVGQSEGFHIPRAPGRTFCPQRVKGLAAGGPLSLSPWDGHTLSDQRAIRFS